MITQKQYNELLVASTMTTGYTFEEALEEKGNKYELNTKVTDEIGLLELDENRKVK
jgi:hypothetical protein